MMSRILASILLVLSAIPAQGRGRQPAPPKPPPLPALDQKGTEGIVQTFTSAEGWAMQAITLLSLGTDWHPAGSAIVLQALQSKDARLRVFGIEQLRRTDQRVFASVCTGPIVENLVDHQLQAKNELVRTRAFEVLKRLLPEAGPDAESVRRWWRQHERDFTPPAWTPPPADPNANRTVAMPLVQRAFDLRDAGLQVAIVIDSTGSMQVAIDAARDAINGVTAILSSIAPKLELGLVHYKDTGDLGDGAKMLEPLTRDQNKVRERLERLIAGGGGDVPEKVDAGIEVALSKEMQWDRNANRLILVVGDAPPHAEDQSALLAMVERAHKQPFQNPKQPVTGTARLPALRPFIVSTIATNANARPSFEEIAKAGGGTCVLMALGQPAGRAALPGQPKAGQQPDAAEQIARHVLVLSFGAAFEAQLRVFVDTFFDYHKAGAF